MMIERLDKFTLHEEIGKGLCYTLYEAVDDVEVKRVFLKVLDPELSNDEAKMTSFRANAGMLKSFQHSNFCNVLDYGCDQGRYFMATEPMDWAPIEPLIMKPCFLSFEKLLHLFSGLANTLRFAHLHGLMHGFLNPKCIYLTSGRSFKVDDFGFSWHVPSLLNKAQDEQSRTVAVYTSPELYEAKGGVVDARVDIYALGATIFHILMGAPPFNGEDLAEIRDQHLSGRVPSMNLHEQKLPPELGAIVAKALNTSRRSGFLNLKELLTSLSDLRAKFLDPPKSQFHEEEALTVRSTSMPKNPFRQLGAFAGKNFRVHLTPVRKFAMACTVLMISLTMILMVAGLVRVPFLSKKAANTDSGVVGASTPVAGMTSVLSHQEKPHFSEPLARKSEKDSISLPVPSNDSPGVSPPGKSELLVEIPRKDIGSNRPTGETGTFPPETSQADAVVQAIATVTFEVQSEKRPIEALVFVDDKFKGKTDVSGILEVEGLDPNRLYNVAISKIGYVSLARKLRPTQNPAQLTFEMKRVGAREPAQTVPGTPPVLEPAVGFGHVSISLENAMSYGYGYVYVDGKMWAGKQKTTPLEIELPVGYHTVEVRRQGFTTTPKEILLVVEKGVTQTISFRLIESEIN